MRGDLDSVFERYITGYILVVLHLSIYGLAHICAQMFVDGWISHNYQMDCREMCCTLSCSSRRMNCNNFSLPKTFCMVEMRSLFKCVFLADLQIL